MRSEWWTSREEKITKLVTDTVVDFCGKLRIFAKESGGYVSINIYLHKPTTYDRFSSR